MSINPENNGLPRVAEVILSFLGLIFLFPVMIIVAILIKATSIGPVFFIQFRVGQYGRHFALYKFRSMHTDNIGIQVTVGGDSRITRIGRIIRKIKLDELPEIWNVVKGDMSLIGPRPEVPRYVDLKNSLWQKVLRVRPGITDPITLQLRNEEELLAKCQDNPERFYLETLQTSKLHGYIDYMERRTWKSDLRVLFESFFAVLIPSKYPPPTLDAIKQ